jgi:hypothetical protein
VHCTCICSDACQGARRHRQKTNPNLSGRNRQLNWPVLHQPSQLRLSAHPMRSAVEGWEARYCAEQRLQWLDKPATRRVAFRRRLMPARLAVLTSIMHASWVVLLRCSAESPSTLRTRTVRIRYGGTVYVVHHTLGLTSINSRCRVVGVHHSLLSQFDKTVLHTKRLPSWR